MVRILITFGSILLEIVTAITQGAIAASLLSAGVIIAFTHLAYDSKPLRRVANWITGFDLPESFRLPADATLPDLERQKHSGRS